MPPLRQIIEELPKLATYFLDQVATREGRPVKAFEPAALDLLRAYAWPGNVRELENMLERAVTLCTTGTISEADLHMRSSASTISEAPSFTGTFLGNQVEEVQRQAIL